MCGIAGILQVHGSIELQENLRAMCRTIRHRGPDGHGIKLFHSDQLSLGLGHQRLSIVDVSGGSQPMANEDMTVWIVFNGEIYNHPQLRPELEARGHKYSTRSDTETILHAYEEWGTDCLSHLQGMFAFAIWNARERSLFLARDRMGIKPLYFTCEGGNLIFASEIKAVLASGLIAPAIAEEMLPEQMTFGYLAGEQTLFAGIHKLMPGHCLTWKEGRVSNRQYWDVPSATVSGESKAQAVEHFSQLFDDTVQSHLMSDVPLGVFLSGGLDSSAIAAAMARHVSGNLKTFSIGFDRPYYSELNYAREVARHLQSDHHEIRLQPDDFFRSLPHLVWHEDEPIRSSPSVALYHVAKLASEHVKVVLTGEGSDELFAGYDRYWASLFNLRWGNLYHKAVPAWFRNRCIKHTLWKWPLPGSWKRMLSHTFLARDRHPQELLFDNWYAIFPQTVHSRLFSPTLYSKVRNVDPYNASTGVYNSRCGGGPLDALLYLDQKTYLVELLMKQDSMSMAASIETRVPFLDHKMVEFATTVPNSLKIASASGKVLVKQALQRSLPPAIISRKKTGFPVPFGDWLRNGFDGPLRKIVLSERTIARGLVDVPFVKALIAENQTGHRNHSEALWSVLNLELWARIFIDKESPDDICREMMRRRP